MNILALDCATNCGFAWGQNGLIQVAGVRTFNLPRGASPGMRWIMFRQWVTGEIRNAVPDVVVYEQPFIAGMRSGTVAEIAYGMCTRVQEVCSELGVEYRPVANSVIKQYATGAGNAKKDAVIKAASERWPNYRPANDPGGDEADARFLCAYAMDGFPDLAAAKAEAVAAERAAAKAAKEREKSERAAKLRTLILDGLAKETKPVPLSNMIYVIGGYVPDSELKRALEGLKAEHLVVRWPRGWGLASE